MALPPTAAAAAEPRQLSVVVASRNAVKINAVAAALRQAMPGVKHSVEGADSDSGVADQPFGDGETLQGAWNRLASIRQPAHSGSLLVAIEGGVGYAPPLPPPAGSAAGRGNRRLETTQQQGGQEQRDPNQPPQQQLECFAWVVVRVPGGGTSHARTASFLLPAAVSHLVLRQGMELGEADDTVFGRVKSGQGSGTIGQLTGGLITRQSYYQHAAMCALIPLLNPQLYPGFDLAAAPGEQP